MPRMTKMNSITSPDLISQINPKNTALMSDYLDYLRSVQRSETTIGGYTNDLLIAFVWALEHNNNKFFVEWTKRDIMQFQNWLINSNKNSPARVRRLKATLSSLSGFIESVLDDEYPNFRNIIHKIESPVNQPVREKTVLLDEQLDELLKQLTESGKHQKACMLALAMYSGRRKSELVRFKVDDFKASNLICGGALYRTTETIKTKGFGLGKYIYCYTLAKNFTPYFERWMKQREEEGIDSIWLFPSAEDTTQQMNPTALNSWAVSFGKMIGVDFYWHALRHYFTTSLARSGLPDGVIQEIIGWTSSDMVRVYKDLSTEEQLDQYFDETGIKSAKHTKISELSV